MIKVFMLSLILMPAMAAAAPVAPGTYDFEECAQGGPGSTQCWQWELRIITSTDAILNVDGFQTLLRLKCDVINGKDGTSIILHDYEPDSMRLFKKGQTLFRLKAIPKGLMTYWVAMGPNVSDERASRAHLFFKRANPAVQPRPTRGPG